MTFHFVASLSILAINSVSTAPKAEVSAILPSGKPPALHRSLHSPIHTRPGHHHFPRLAISCSHSSNLFTLLSSLLDSKTSFKTHSS
jgi:hypothetical protein